MPASPSDQNDTDRPEAGANYSPEMVARFYEIHPGEGRYYITHLPGGDFHLEDRVTSLTPTEAEVDALMNLHPAPAVTERVRALVHRIQNGNEHMYFCAAVAVGEACDCGLPELAALAEPAGERVPRPPSSTGATPRFYTTRVFEGGAVVIYDDRGVLVGSLHDSGAPEIDRFKSDVLAIHVGSEPAAPTVAESCCFMVGSIRYCTRPAKECGCDSAHRGEVATFPERPPAPTVAGEGRMTSFERTVREMNPDGCGCACHTGTGVATSCEHCPAPAETAPESVAGYEGLAKALDRYLSGPVQHHPTCPSNREDDPDICECGLSDLFIAETAAETVVTAISDAGGHAVVHGDEPLTPADEGHVRSLIQTIRANQKRDSIEGLLAFYEAGGVDGAEGPHTRARVLHQLRTYVADYRAALAVEGAPAETAPDSVEGLRKEVEDFMSVIDSDPGIIDEGFVRLWMRRFRAALSPETATEASDASA